MTYQACRPAFVGTKGTGIWRSSSGSSNLPLRYRSFFTRRALAVSPALGNRDVQVSGISDGDYLRRRGADAYDADLDRRRRDGQLLQPGHPAVAVNVATAVPIVAYERNGTTYYGAGRVGMY